MISRLTIRQLGIAAVVIGILLNVGMGLVAMRAIAALQTDYRNLETRYWEDRLASAELQAAAAQLSAERRGLLLTGGREFRQRVEDAQHTLDQTLDRVRRREHGQRELPMIARIEAEVRASHEANEEVARAREGGINADAAAKLFEQRVAPRVTALGRAIHDYATYEAGMLADGQRATEDAARRSLILLGVMVVMVFAFALGVSALILRSLMRQIGKATDDLRGSTAQLQSAASQQATASSEQATAMSEVSSTMKELHTSSHQIAESARRVARIADETTAAARAGEAGVAQAGEAMDGIRRQVDQVVTHMVDLGRRSQQIGGVLEIIKELAEQTNILAINATIEAAGAGDAGKRFGAVAEEVRKLAERVAGSAREIRELIDQVRAATNTTLMATEDGSKAVDAGRARVGQVASSFARIVEQVGTTSEAAREIELGTQQQSTAVEQVTFAIADAAQAARETEASSRQTLVTASNLADVSRALTRMVSNRGDAAPRP